MNLFQALVLGILQGVAEFLPISSSGHLIIAEHFFGLDTVTLKSFDVLLHLGTFFAVVVYFRKDILEMIKAFFCLIFGKRKFSDPFVKLIIYIIVGTIPAILAGFLFGDFIDANYRTISHVGLDMMIIGTVFVIGEYVYKKYAARKKEVSNWWRALIIGLAQCVALMPGFSRSGTTMVTGIFQGIERSAAARFSFLLSLPAILGAAALTAIKIPSAEYSSMPLGAYGLGFLTSFLFGLLSIWFLMKFLRKHSLLVFALYMLIVGLSVSLAG